MLPMPKDLQTPIINQHAKITLEKRYLLKDEKGEIIESPKELFWRVASTIAHEENKYANSQKNVKHNMEQYWAEKFYDIMAGLKFLPNSPTLMNAGKKDGQLSACFVLPVEDSIEGIFDAVKYAALIHKSGGGTGFSFSRLRSKGSIVGSTGGIASGPLSFLRIFNTATEQIKQGGKRRGANMGILRVDHPDIIDFIRAKEIDGEFNNFNFSVGITDKFMEALINDKRYELINPQDGTISGVISAKSVWDMLVDKAWLSGDPGIVFLDRINHDNPTPEQGEIEATNPCGEQPLLPYEACNLGSINLAKFYIPGYNNGPYPEYEGINWRELKEVVHIAVRFLDNVIDASCFPLPQIKEKVSQNRKIGLGVMGFADLLYMLEIPYNSDKAIVIANRIMNFIRQAGWQASWELAGARGAFPAYEKSIYKNEAPYRNATITTIAPTGTLSIIAGCSSGIEPNFALCFTKNILDGEKLTTINPVFEKALHDIGLDTKEIMAEIAEKGSIANINSLPENMRNIFVTAMDIKPVDHLNMQAAFQKFTDNAVSKTVNLPNSATKDDIREIYKLAWEKGCKGVTVYRDGCKSSQVLVTGKRQNVMNNKISNNEKGINKKSKYRERPEIVNGFTQKVKTGLGTMYVTVNEIDGKPFEVFATIGKSGRSIMAKAEAISRLISLALRSGVSVDNIITQIKGIGGEHPVFREKGLLLSIPDAIAWVLESHYCDKPIASSKDTLEKETCPECGGELVYSEGCVICPACNYSRCG